MRGYIFLMLILGLICLFIPRQYSGPAQVTAAPQMPGAAPMEAGTPARYDLSAKRAQVRATLDDVQGLICRELERRND